MSTKDFCFSNLIKMSFKIYELGSLISKQVSAISQLLFTTSNWIVLTFIGGILKAHESRNAVLVFDSSLSYSSASHPCQSLGFLQCALGISVVLHHSHYLEQVAITSPSSCNSLQFQTPWSIISVNSQLFTPYNENNLLNVILLPKPFQCFLM